MGEKDLFHEQADRVPLIIADPDPRADITRGQINTDPDGFHAPGGLPGHQEIKADLHERLFEWARKPRQRATAPDEAVENTFVQERICGGGILIGHCDEAELETATRDEWHPRLAAHNPIIAPTLRKLLRKEDKHDL